MEASLTRLDDLQYKGLFLYQQAGLPCFTQDSVLLAAYATLGPKDTAVDIGAGTGALAVLCHARTGAAFTCVEKNPALCTLLEKSIDHNALPLHICNMDWADAPAALGHGRFSAALCNPPYFAAGTKSPHAARREARSGFEDGGTPPLVSAVHAAAKLLKNGGKLYLCYPATQLADALCILRENGLEPKRMQLVAEMAHKPPYLVLLEAKKGAKPGIKQEALLLLKENDGSPTKAYQQIYHLPAESE